MEKRENRAGAEQNLQEALQMFLQLSPEERAEIMEMIKRLGER